MSYTFLQNYWWFLIALLGGLLVFLMFVQGANLHLGNRKLSDLQKRMILNSTGRKWELTFTTLVTFGGAYWVWVLILITFVFQAVSYEFQNKRENLIGSKAFRGFLMANGILAPFLIGTAVGTFFTGSDFSVNKMAITDPGAPVISTWGSSLHGLEALGQYHAVLLGCTLVFLTAILGALYILNNVSDTSLDTQMRRFIKIGILPFLAFFLSWTAILLLRRGYAADEAGTISLEKYKYLHNLLQMPAVLVMLLVGVVSVLWGIFAGAFTKSTRGIWPAGIGTVLVVMSVFFVAGYNGTAYYPSCTEIQSSLTIRNSSSSRFTLQVMFWVSLLIPFVVAYIAYAWKQMDRRKITGNEISETPHKY